MHFFSSREQETHFFKKDRIINDFMNFSSLGLSAPILEAVAEHGYETPTPVQAKGDPCGDRRQGCDGGSADRYRQDSGFHSPYFRTPFKKGAGSGESGTCTCFDSNP